MKRCIIALALFVSLATEAMAGIHARIEGPDADGITYTARTLSLDEGDTLDPWAYAEGVIDGKRQSWLIRLQSTSEPGVYQFTRTWPTEGVWMIRFCLGHPPAPATVATLRADGSVRKNKLYWRTDGARECHVVLKKAAKLDPNEEEC
jgi:hypothetical protein